MYICTGNYARLFQQFYTSCLENFLPEHSKHFYVWTNENIGEYDENIVSVIPKQFEEWPAATLQRYSIFNTIKDILLSHKYVYFCNADLHFYEKIGEEVLPDEEHPMVGVEHIQFVKEHLRIKDIYENTEHNIFSNAFIDDCDIPYTYIFGCFNGGTSEAFMAMSETIAKWTEEDFSKGIVPIWHDESYLNAYRLENPSIWKLLSPDYAYPDMCGLTGHNPKIYKLSKKDFFLSNDYRTYLGDLNKKNRVGLTAAEMRNPNFFYGDEEDLTFIDAEEDLF